MLWRFGTLTEDEFTERFIPAVMDRNQSLMHDLATKAANDLDNFDSTLDIIEESIETSDRDTADWLRLWFRMCGLSVGVE